MNAPGWERVKALFQEALERPPHERAAYVRENCGNDSGLRREVESLLATHEAAARFAERPAIDLLHELASVADGPASTGRIVSPGDRLGVFEIQSLLVLRLRWRGRRATVYTRRNEPSSERSGCLTRVAAQHASDLADGSGDDDWRRRRAHDDRARHRRGDRY